MFADLDEEAVTGVDVDGMVFDPKNFKAVREVSFRAAKIPFGFIIINRRNSVHLSVEILQCSFMSTPSKPQVLRCLNPQSDLQAIPFRLFSFN